MDNRGRYRIHAIYFHQRPSIKTTYFNKNKIRKIKFENNQMHSFDNGRIFDSFGYIRLLVEPVRPCHCNYIHTLLSDDTEKGLNRENRYRTNINREKNYQKSYSNFIVYFNNMFLFVIERVWNAKYFAVVDCFLGRKNYLNIIHNFDFI